QLRTIWRPRSWSGASRRGMKGMKAHSDPLVRTQAAPSIPMLGPLQKFAEDERSGGILLLLCTVAAIVWANSPWAGSYYALWHTNFSVSLGGQTLSQDLHFWVNDFLMVIFFVAVGLEIKREILVGELACMRQSLLPVVAAAGGVAVPALIYTLF